ncbi:MAG: ROK family protein, partial [Actinomyces sp.]
IISDGHLLRGWLGLTGEVGHMPVEPEGLACRCGRRGCWETRSGLQALTSIFPPGDAVRDETTSLDERIELLRRRFDAGDAELTRRLELSQRALARALAILTDVLNPEVIVLSGYLAAFADVFISPTASALQDRLLDQRAAVRLETSHLGQWASSYGAALVALESVLDNPTLVDLRPAS